MKIINLNPRKEIFLIVSLGLMPLLSCCGHSVFSYGDGIGMDVGIDPEHMMASFTLRYGKTLTAVTRDNVEIELAGKADVDGIPSGEKKSDSKVGTDGTLRIKVGRQINGYAVDLVKAGADAQKVVDALSDK